MEWAALIEYLNWRLLPCLEENNITTGILWRQVLIRTKTKEVGAINELRLDHQECISFSEPVLRQIWKLRNVGSTLRQSSCQEKMEVETNLHQFQRWFLLSLSGLTAQRASKWIVCKRILLSNLCQLLTILLRVCLVIEYKLVHSFYFLYLLWSLYGEELMSYEMGVILK